MKKNTIKWLYSVPGIKKIYIIVLIIIQMLNGFSADKESLIMYTCYPFDELGLTSDRFFVYAKFVSGPVIDKNS